MSPHMPLCGFSNQIFHRIMKNRDGFLCGNPNWMGSAIVSAPDGRYMFPSGCNEKMALSGNHGVIHNQRSHTAPPGE